MPKGDGKGWANQHPAARAHIHAIWVGVTSYEGLNTVIHVMYTTDNRKPRGHRSVDVLTVTHPKPAANPLDLLRAASWAILEAEKRFEARDRANSNI